MTREKWQEIVKTVAFQKERVSVALIVDSPWIPGFQNMSHFDYYLFPDRWLNANLKIMRRFPEVIFIPGFWVEYGMAIEPSGFGSHITWHNNRTPDPHPVIDNISKIESIKVPDPYVDGLMPFALHLYKLIDKELKNTEYSIKIVASRGPLAIASWLFGLTNLMLAIKEAPSQVKKLIEMTTEASIRWIKVQKNVLTYSTAEGVLILDDIVGFLSPKDYAEFAHPYLKSIFDEFPNFIKIYHNDSPNLAILPELTKLNINIFNFSGELNFKEVREKMGHDICLMGNIHPLEVLTRSNPRKIKTEVKKLLTDVKDPKGTLLSAGGGVPPGVPAENIDALVEATNEYNESLE